MTAEQKAIIERATALQGRTVSDFVLASLQDAARHAIREHERLTVSTRDSQAFVAALLNLHPVNDSLRDATSFYSP